MKLLNKILVSSAVISALVSSAEAMQVQINSKSNAKDIMAKFVESQRLSAGGSSSGGISSPMPPTHQPAPPSAPDRMMKVRTKVKKQHTEKLPDGSWTGSSTDVCDVKYEAPLYDARTSTPTININATTACDVEIDGKPGKVYFYGFGYLANFDLFGDGASADIKMILPGFYWIPDVIPPAGSVGLSGGSAMLTRDIGQKSFATMLFEANQTNPPQDTFDSLFVTTEIEDQ